MDKSYTKNTEKCIYKIYTYTLILKYKVYFNTFQSDLNKVI